MTPHTDYHRLLKADMDERIARIDALAVVVYDRAVKFPEMPDRSIAEKLEDIRYGKQAAEQRNNEEETYETTTQTDRV